MIDCDFLTTYEVFLLTLFVPIALIFFYAFLTKLPKTGRPYSPRIRERFFP